LCFIKINKKFFFSSFEDLLKAFEKAKPVIAKEEKGVVPRFYIRYHTATNRVADPHHFNLDLFFHINADPYTTFTSVRIRILIRAI
jgi:hypothetical protein